MYTTLEKNEWVRAFAEFEISEEMVRNMLDPRSHYLPTKNELTSVITQLKRAKSKGYTNLFRFSSLKCTDLAFISGSLAWITACTMTLNREITGNPLRYFALAALSGNVAAYQYAEKTLPKPQIMGGLFVEVTQSVFVSGSADMFRYALTIPHFNNLMRGEYFGGMPYVIDISKYGTSEMIALATRVDYIIPRLNILFANLSKQTQEEVVKFLIIDIQSSNTNRITGLQALALMAKLFPEFQNTYEQQCERIITRFNSILDSENWSSVEQDELHHLNSAGLIGANALIKKRVALHAIHSSIALLENNLFNEGSTRACLEKLQATKFDGDLPEALFLIGELLGKQADNKSSNDDDPNLTEEPLFYYFVSALLGHEQAERQFDAVIFNGKVETAARRILHAILKQKMNIAQERSDFLKNLEAYTPGEVISVIQELICEEQLSRQISNHFVQIIATIAVSPYWTKGLQKKFNVAFTDWLKHSGNERIFFALLSQYYVGIPNTVFMPALAYVINSVTLSPSQHAMAVLLAAGYANSSNELQLALKTALPNVMEGNPEVISNAQLALKTHSTQTVSVDNRLLQTITPIISEQIIMLREHEFFNDDKIYLLLTLLIELSGPTPPAISFDEYLIKIPADLLLLRELIIAASKLHYWIENPKDLHPEIGREQYHLILRQVFMSLHTTPRPPADDANAPPIPRRSSYDALSPAVFVARASGANVATFPSAPTPK